MGKPQEKEKSLLLNLPTTLPKKPSTDMSKFEKDKNNFHEMSHLEPHEIRRQKILKEHPEIEKLFVKDISSLYYTIGLTILQLIIIWLIKNYVHSFWVLVLITYFIGAVINHGLYILMHDITHFTCFKSVLMNQLLGILSNVPQCLPSAISFGRYHRDHHTYMGDEENDPDIPLMLEIKTIRSSFAKCLLIIFLPVFYALRPFFKKPKAQIFMEKVNIVVILTTNYLIYRHFGFYSFFYLIFGTLWGLSINPVGAHIIAEHYEFNKAQETYSYYGILNNLSFNIGHHIEHHDFPLVPWTLLPKIRELAPEYYNFLPQVDSYAKVLIRFIFDCEIGPWSRIIRKPEKTE